MLIPRRRGAIGRSLGVEVDRLSRCFLLRTEVVVVVWIPVSILSSSTRTPPILTNFHPVIDSSP